jgi:hypothetical protein
MIVFGIHLASSDIWLLGICGALIMALIGYRLLIASQRHNAFINAASTFRSEVLRELVGFYPIDQVWDKNEWPRIYQSIPRINSAATEFRCFVTRKTEFDRAISEYNKYCREKTTDKVFAFAFPSMEYGGIEEQAKELDNIVSHILSFANEK